jgi:RimJ/RimL family protein N-acetyltransferase
MDRELPPITLRETMEDDLSDLVALWNNGSVMCWVGYPDGLGYRLDDALAWWKRLRTEPLRHHFVVSAPGIRFAGEAFYRVEPDQRRAGADIKLLPVAQGRGIATAALLALCERVFSGEPGVDVVWVEPSAENTAARRLYARCGFGSAPRPPDLPPGDSYWERRRRGTLATQRVSSQRA